MKLIAANEATSVLAGSISNVALTANLAPGTGVLFAPPGADEYFVGTFKDAATGLINEIVWVTNVTGDTITMIRGQEGTTPQAWAANDTFSNLITAGTIEKMLQIGEGITEVKMTVLLSSATFIPDDDTVYADVTCYGPGGGGGGIKNTLAQTISAGGGGSGARAHRVLTKAQISTSQIVTIPAAGAGGTNVGGNGAAGAGSTTFGSLVSAGPGGGGGGNTVSYTRGTPGAAGVPNTGTDLEYGQAGGNGHSGADVGFGGDGAGPGGGPGTGFDGGGMAGINASGNQGGGGSGACANTTTGFVGGNGAPGKVVIIEYISASS